MALASRLKYYEDAYLGRVFIGSTAVAGTAFPISTGTAATFGLWNTNPGKLAVLLRLNIGYTSGTIALGEIGLANVSATAVATGSNITAFTDGVLGTTIRNARISQGDASGMRFTPSAATVVGNTACYWTGSSIESATEGLGIFTMSHDFDGAVIVPYGQFLFVCGSVAQTALFTMSLVWAEVDV
jgi:hypothetical protein